MEKVCCLLSIENNYDQPDNNLEIIFAEKPTKEKLKSYFLKKLSLKISESDLEKILNGDEIRLSDTDFRIENWEVN